MSHELKQKLSLFIQKRFAELLGLSLFAAGAIGFFSYFEPLVFNKLTPLLTPLFGLAYLAAPSFMMAWGLAVMLHRKNIWRSWRLVLSLFSFLGLNMALSFFVSFKGLWGARAL